MKEEVIYSYVYNVATSVFKMPGNHRSKFTIIKCCNRDNCNLYRRGECNLLTIGVFSNPSCPYGNKYIEEGYTKRAKNNFRWCQEREKRYPNVKVALSRATDIMTRVGEFVYLPYPHLNMNKQLPIESHSSVFISGTKFFPFDEFQKPEIIHSIVNFKPQAMMGGEIRSYQEKVIPDFVNHLYEVFPEIYKNCNTDGYLDKYIKNYSNIGRLAYVSTLKKGCRVWKKDSPNTIWVWDGEFLQSNSERFFNPIVKIEEIEIRIKPKKGAVIIITSEDQVDSNTKFLK